MSVTKLAIATHHAMQGFNDLQYSNRCRFISIALPVATATLYLDTEYRAISYIEILSQFLSQLSF